MPTESSLIQCTGKYRASICIQALQEHTSQGGYLKRIATGKRLTTYPLSYLIVPFPLPSLSSELRTRMNLLGYMNGHSHSHHHQVPHWAEGSGQGTNIPKQMPSANQYPLRGRRSRRGRESIPWKGETWRETSSCRRMNGKRTAQETRRGMKSWMGGTDDRNLAPTNRIRAEMHSRSMSG